MWQEVACRIHDMNPAFRIGDADVNVQAKDQKRTSDGLQLLNKQFVSLVIEYFLVLPARKRMCRSSNNHQARLGRQTGNNAAQACNIRSGFLNVLTDTCADLDHGLDHLGLDLLAENHLALFQELGDVRPQFASLRINYLKLLFNSQCELIEHIDVSRTMDTITCLLPE